MACAPVWKTLLCFVAEDISDLLGFTQSAVIKGVPWGCAISAHCLWVCPAGCAVVF